MSKKVLILNGSARKNGNTAKLVQAFSRGAVSTGHHIQEFHIDSMDIHSCKGCLRAGKNSQSTCSQKDDMDKIYSAFADCNVVVFASPVCFRTITGTLKTVTDRLYAELECLGYGKFVREACCL